MPFRRSFRVAALVVAVSLGVGAAQADAVITTVDGGGAATAPAEPVELPFDTVSVFQTGELTPAIRDRAFAAARAVNAPAVVARGFSGLLKGVRRNGAYVQRSSGAGWAFPMAVSALPLTAAGGVMGRDVSGVLSRGRVVMSQTSADIRGAKVGDVVDMVGPSGSTVSFVIGRIGSDAEVGGTELVMTTTMADRLGADIPTRVLIYGQFDRAALTAALARQGLCTSATGLICQTGSSLRTKVRRSWDPADPDAQLSLAETKRLLGEFDFYHAGLSASGWTAMNQTWVRKYLPARTTYPTGINARCNVGPLGAAHTVKSDLTAALREVVSSGLSFAIDVGNTNSFGGCGTGSVRFARITQALGAVSRHSWGQPIDMNTNSNCQGCVPRMDCRVVRIFRKHGFAWGGNFLTADGMHFEWVGEPRHALQYDSRFCDNLPTGRIQSLRTPPPAGRDTLFADDGFTAEEHD
ncbi:MAG: M15 family metallopeptidase [Ilumatobacteraceae bacterium]